MIGEWIAPVARAVQSAGRVVTQATMMLAELYAGEATAKGRGGLPRSDGLDREQDHLPGKAAVAKATAMDPAALSRPRPLIEAPKARVREASTAIEARGEVVTPRALEPVLQPPALRYALVDEVEPEWPPRSTEDYGAYDPWTGPPEEIDEKAADEKIFSRSLGRVLTDEEAAAWERRKKVGRAP